MSDTTDQLFDLPEPERFAAILDAVLELRAKHRAAINYSQNIAFFSGTAESVRYESFLAAVFQTVTEGLKQQKFEEALQVAICHCFQLGWQTAKYDSEN